jgi:protein-tyrosine phosphatase
MAAVWIGPKIRASGKEGETKDSRREAGQSFQVKLSRPKLSRPKLSQPRKTKRRKGMDLTWLTDRIAVGGGIWNAENMAKVGEAGITHVIDMQLEFDDRPLAGASGIAVLWNPTDDDFEPKPAELFQCGVEFAEAALGADGKLFIHCAAGVHRGPMMAAAVLSTMGWELKDAIALIETRRPLADFPEVYVRSLEEFLSGRRFTAENTEERGG